LATAAKQPAGAEPGLQRGCRLPGRRRRRTAVKARGIKAQQTAIARIKRPERRHPFKVKIVRPRSAIIVHF
jgi:hypothetical protein